MWPVSSESVVAERTVAAGLACGSTDMTKPEERTKAVVETRDFLRILAAADEITIPGLVQAVAAGLLEHYPIDADLGLSASALPSIWAYPNQN
jgi:hypothetical protein